MAKRRDKDAPKSDEAPADEAPKTDPKPAEAVSTKKSEKERPTPGSVPLRTFQAAGGIKPDQMAPFTGYARRLKLGPLTIPEWRDACQKFQQRPV